MATTNSPLQLFLLQCPQCSRDLEVKLPEGVVAVQCVLCDGVFAVKVTRQQVSFKNNKNKKPLKRKLPPREPTAYNIFVKEELRKVKDERPDLHHREAFRLVTQRWQTSDKNPNKGCNTETWKEDSSALDPAAGVADSAVTPVNP